jgi:RNA polymerase sigma-70 factor (ECF subfamily)
VYAVRTDRTVSETRRVPTDAALVELSRAGERWAMEALFRRYAPMANGVALRLLGRDDEVDDVVQTAFIHAFTKMRRLENPNAFGGWLRQIVVSTVLKSIRNRRLLVRLGLRRHAPVDVEALAHSGASPEVARELRELYSALEELPPKLRTPLILRRVEGLSLEDVANATGTSLASVKRHIAEADALLASREASS